MSGQRPSCRRSRCRCDRELSVVCRPSAAAASGAPGARFFWKNTSGFFAEISQMGGSRAHTPAPETLTPSTVPRTRAPAQRALSRYGHEGAWRQLVIRRGSALAIGVDGETATGRIASATLRSDSSTRELKVVDAVEGLHASVNTTTIVVRRVDRCLSDRTQGLPRAMGRTGLRRRHEVE